MTSPEKRPDRGRKVPPPPDTLEIAVSLARAGWPVFPVSIYESAAGKREKVPAVRWKEWATTDVDVVKAAWKGEHRGRWIGVYCAKAGPHGIVVLDVDPGGDDSIAEAGLEIPKTFNYPTHRKGGRHHVYAAPEGVELTIAKALFDGVDVRSGAGLMVYYGPKLKAAPELAPAPDWILVERGARAAAGEHGDRAPSADEEAFRARLSGGKPLREHRKAVEAVDFPAGAAHDPMLSVVSTLVRLGRDGAPGIGRLMDETRERYVAPGGDRHRDWDNAVEGSVKRLGLPPTTFALTKRERREIRTRNKPKNVEKAKRERRATLVEDRDAPAPDDLSDDALADRFADAVRGTWAHDPAAGILRYDGYVWKRVDEALLVERCRKYLRGIRKEMTALAIRRGDKVLEADARRLGSKSTISAVARLTAGILLDEAPTLDRDPDLLNVLNGVVDLRTGELRERRPDDFFTKIAAADYVPGLTSADWDQALKAVPKAVRPWLQVRLGQAATGRISVDKSVPFLIGGGDNGKSVILGAARNTLGSYAVTVPDKLLLGSDSDHPTEIMTLRGARLAVFEELPRGGRINAQRMKLLAGTNELTGRFMGKDFVTFPATHTLVGASNHLPVISDVDDAIWNRVAPVNFPWKYVDAEPVPRTNQRRADPGLRDRLAETPSSAVLSWLVEGARLSYLGIPPKPAAVAEALLEWRGDADPVLGFVRDRLTFDRDSVIVATDLYTEFGRYLEGRGQARWSDNLMAVSFSGHSSLEGVRKRQFRLRPSDKLSRPAFAQRAIPARAVSWFGIRFKEDPKPISEAERDAATLADLESRLR